MSDTPLKRSTRRTTSVRRTVETTTRRTSISVPTGNTSVNIATAFKLSGFSDSTVDPVESSRNSRTSIHNTPVPTKNQEDTATEEELSDKNSATDSQEDEQFETPHSTGLGRRLLASILPKSPMWIRAGTPQRNESQERDSQTNSESESDPETHQSKPLQTRRTRSLGLRRNIEPPNTVNLVAGRYYLRPRANSPSNSPARVPAQIQEHLASSSDDEEWSPKPALYESASQSKGAISRKLEGDFEDNSEEPSSDEYSYSETESEDDYPEVIKVPIWRPIQAAIVGCFAGIGQIIKSILSAIGFLIFMVFWILKEIAVTLYSYTSYIATTLFVAPVRAIASSERVQDLVSMGARGFTTLFRFITKYLGLVLIFAAISGVVWTNLSSRDHEHLLDNIRENLDYHKYIEKLPKINPPKLKLPEISLPDISLPEISLPEISLPDVSLSTFKSYLPSFDVRLTPWLEKQRKAFDEYAPSFKVPSKPQPPKITDGKVVAPQPERSDVDSESFAELQSRLESLEDSLRQLSFVANRLVDQNDDHREAVSSEVTHQANTDKEIESLKDLIGEYVKANENQKITVDSILQAIKENDHKLEGFSLNIGSLRKQVDLAESKMNALDADVANTYIGLEKVKEEVAKLSQLDYYSHQILDTVKHTLPKYLVASKNGETGSVEIAPEFYHYLNSLFVTPAKLESVVQENLVRSKST
ncbi:hypothetical protein K493DRAFT_65013 [Basidiobolus meristosporus CBS 931.73]|uniref:Uncharacterized protein n=1 Tax=Basidiobolus meristosporus CBS 931.73 TaxID=1314790 RepID=A0A1Y1Z0G3_9FUNG|nr:hypothetical protein K493DRAFT_65013 [Basidiobolus meristosporus CBS 931.73]|eukprot:ORY03782.1 hypothetical protein K493DRAFT_65013 [Basidiobolus meristosporus CBS 931.73]